MRHDGPDPGRPGILSGKVLIVVPLISGANPSPPTRHPEGTRPLGAGRGESDLTPAKTPGLCAGRGGEGIEQAGSAMERAGGAEWCRRVGESQARSKMTNLANLANLAKLANFSGAG
jgi:hypothetical protein